jgi:hypothetical protein
MAKYENFIVTKQFLDENPNAVFVFGDNLRRVGYGGAAALRDHPQTYGFITKKNPDNMDESFYRPESYNIDFLVYAVELQLFIEKNIDKTFYISQLGGGLANRYKIWEKVLKPGLEKYFSRYDNVVFLWDKEIDN